GLPARLRQPFVPGLQPDAEPRVVDAQESVGSLHNGVGSGYGHVLRHHADVDLIAPDISVAVETDAVGQTPEQLDVAFQADVRHDRRTAQIVDVDDDVGVGPDPVPVDDGLNEEPRRPRIEAEADVDDGSDHVKRQHEHRDAVDVLDFGDILGLADHHRVLAGG